MLGKFHRSSSFSGLYPPRFFCQLTKVKQEYEGPYKVYGQSLCLLFPQDVGYLLIDIQHNTHFRYAAQWFDICIYFKVMTTVILVLMY